MRKWLIERNFILLHSFYNGYGGVEGLLSGTPNDFDNALNGVNMAGKGDDNTAPRAFLNYIWFDENMNYVTAGFKQITTAAQGAGVHELVQLDQPFTADKEGFFLAYLSNENEEAVNIHFDDFTVTQTKTNLVQTDDYYPFGLTFNEYQRTASTVNFMNTFQDQEYEKETGWVKFKWRNHQPDIGRFFNIDPLAEDYVYNSPYAFSENDVISAIELEGLEKIRVNNYSLHQSNSIKKQTLKKREINQKPYSDRTGPKNDFKIEKLEGLKEANTEIRRIVDYGMNNGFKDDFFVNKLEDDEIKVPEEVKSGDKTTTSKVMDPDAPLSIDIIGIQETEDGKLQEVSIGTYNPENETENVKADFWKDVAGGVIESIVDYFIMKGNSPQLIAPVTVPDEEQKQN